VLLLSAFHALPVRADSTDGTTPLALKPGAPAGSYQLSELDKINPYNGSLNFGLPLLSIGGRGTAGYTMTLPIEQKWRIHVQPLYFYVYNDGGTDPLPEPQVSRIYFPTANWWSGIKPGYGPGVMQGRVAQLDAQVCPDSTMRAGMTLTRLTFTAADGTEFELQDTKTGGMAKVVGICDQTGFNREKIFVTADGSAATFISDANIVDNISLSSDVFLPSGYLLLRDGTRYRFDNGTVTWQRDRNGNTVSFIYDSFKRATLIKDSLHRQVTITYATSTVLYDEITYKGFGGATRIIRVNYAYLQDPGSLRSDYSIQTYAQLFPISGSSMNSNYNPKILRSVTLPNTKQYQFQYNSYGELARVVLPTGGAFEYDHASGVGGDGSGLTGGFDENSLNVYRRVTTKRVYATGTALESKITFSNTESVPCSGCVVIDQYGSDGVTRMSQRRLYFEGNPGLSFYQAPTDYSPWKEGREYQSEAVAANGTTILQRVTRTWQQPVASASWPLTQPETNSAAKSNNPQVTQVITTLEPSQANKVSKQTFAYDKYTNQTDLYEYDFATGNAGALVRRSHTDFLTAGYDTLNPSATSPDLNQTSHIRNLTTKVSIFDAGGVERARSTTEYDNYSLDGADCLHSFHCSLLPRANISGLDSLFGTSYIKRGNPTASTRYLLSSGAVTGSVSSYSQYDVAGNVVRVLDPRSTLTNNIATTIEYDDRFGTPNNEARSNTVPGELTGFTSFGFPTRVTNALGHTSYAQFDYYLGKAVNGEDANGVVASGSFNDSLDRPRQIRRAIGTSAENQSTFEYDDTLRTVTVFSDRDMVDDNLLVSKVEYDQFGRTIAKRQYEGGANYIVTKTQFDALGRAYKSSNPFRPWQGEAAVWTTQQFDALGRVVSVTTPDNAVASTSYSGNTVTVTDQSGKARRSVTDSLGRMTDVYEDPAGLNYQTTYTYDVLDDLVKVTQGTQQRFFMYDSLKRLIRTRNPEQGTLASLSITDPLTNNSSWSISYDYDSVSNLRFKTDGRGMLTENRYDSLNRVTTILYRVNGQPDPNTGDVEFLYDNASYGKGRLWLTYRWGAKPSQTAVGQYDAVGQVKQLYNLFGDGQGGWSAGYEVSRTYNRAGAVTSQINPSGHTLNYGYDMGGRTNLLAGNLGDGLPRTYVQAVDYAPWGTITRERLGTNAPVYNKTHYNVRGQLCDVRVSNVSDEWGGELGAFVNHYSTNGVPCGSGSDNNGNVLMSQTILNSYYMEDRYAYDSLNRLTSIHEYSNGATLTGSQQYEYDRWGNRTIKPVSTLGLNRQFTVNTATNQLGIPGGQPGEMTYDKAGNLTRDTYTGAGDRVYDADNRITAAQDNLAGWSYYTYSANGQRIRRKINNQETWLIYGIDGELVAEYAVNGAPGSPLKEYGYRNGQLLVTAGIAAPANVGWTNTAGVAASGNNLTKTAGTGWGNAGASSTQSITSGDGYVEVTASETSTARIFGLSHTDANQNWTTIDFGMDLDVGGTIYVFESGANRGTFGTYTTGDKLQVAIVGGVVKYKKNGTVFYTSTVAPTYPLVVDSSLYSSGSTLSSVVLGSGSNGAAQVQWLVSDHLGTPRMIIDQTGSVGNIKRHDYLPYGEELWAGTSGRTSSMGYVAGDGVRQQFTEKERDVETGQDYFLARYYSSIHGRFTSTDPLMASAEPSLPQSWNRYSYVFNNPMAYIDPDGMKPDDYYADRDGQITIDETPGTTDRFYVQNHDGTYTLAAALQRKNGLVQVPDNGLGFNRYGVVDAGGMDRTRGENVGQGDHFLEPIAAAALFGLTNVLNSDQNLTMSYGDMSSSNGSDPYQAGGQHHAGHGHNGNRSGLDIDFRYLNNNGVSFQSPTARSDPQFSVPNNQSVYDTAVMFGFTTNYQGNIRGANGQIPGVTPNGLHNDHGHLGFNLADANIHRRIMLVTRP